MTFRGDSRTARLWDPVRFEIYGPTRSCWGLGLAGVLAGVLPVLQFRLHCALCLRELVVLVVFGCSVSFLSVTLFLVLAPQQAVDDTTTGLHLGPHRLRVRIEGEQPLLAPEDTLLPHDGAPHQLLVDRELQELQDGAQLSLGVVNQVVVEHNLDAAGEVAGPAEVHQLPALELIAHELLPICGSEDQITVSGC